MKKLEIVFEEALLPFLLLISVFTLVLVSVSARAQEVQEKEVLQNQVPLQVSFAYPLGSNGFKSYEATNRFSLNLLFGLQGGVSGAEVGGFANVIRHDVVGFQAAGFSNVVGGNVAGFQTAGFTNTVGGSSKGFMAAGFVNTVNKDMRGLQAAGYVNYAGKGSSVMQLAGFVNVNLGQQKGINAAGFANVAKEVDGAQISGFVNVTKKLKGTQIGIFNLADTVEKGVPLGVLSIVRKNGVREWEIGASEALHAYVKFKTGVPKLYNILLVGAQITGDRSSWAYGYGLGSTLLDAGRIKVGLEGVCMHVNYKRIWTDDINLLNRVSLPIEFKSEKKVTFFVAPSANLMVSKLTNKKGEISGPEQFIPYHLYDKTFDNTNLQGWVGLDLGIRF